MSELPATSQASEQEEDSQEMMNVFDCVWVKVEELDVNEKDSVPFLPTADENPMEKPLSKYKKRKVHKCDQCDYTTAHKPLLKIHIYSHSDTDFSCQHCNYKSKWPMSIKRHISIVHEGRTLRKPKPGNFSCDLCSYTTNYKWNLSSHKRKHKLEKQYKCRHCHYESAYRHNYLKHCKTHDDKAAFESEVFSCDKCPFQTKYKGHIQRHLAKIHNEVLEGARYTCQLCGFKTDDNWRLKMHQERSQTRKVIKCALCEFKSFYKCESKRHDMLHFQNIACDESVNVYQQSSSANVAGKSVENSVGAVEESANENSVGNVEKSADTGNVSDAYFRCQHCIFETLYEGIMEQHLARMHKEIVTHEYSCPKCIFSTKEKFRLTAHLQNSKSDQLLHCNLCNFETFFKCENRKHKQSHFNEVYGNGRSIDCSGLNEQVDTMIKESQNPENSTHLTEVGEKSVESVGSVDNFNTDVMDASKRFPEYQVDPECVEWNTIQVLETPGKEKPFQCNFCLYSSKFKASVQRHFQRLHAGNQNRPYKCCNCDFKTKTKEQIALHNKRSQSLVQINCKACDFNTYFKCAFNYHQKQHHTFKCTICSYSCKQKYDLTKHFANYHMGNGLKCQFCDFTAVRKESILNHEAMHTGVKPFKCKLCSYSSVRKTLLMNHYRRQHRDKIKSINGEVNETHSESVNTSVEDENSAGSDVELVQYDDA
uniref:C2H2-type domain-containing protein n=1 Tax=Pectinophora gossypiella TaxID=13191 RepID=A0A1E1WNY7_PECGO